MSHPTVRLWLREGWALSRRMARAAHLPAPFTPEEMRSLARACAPEGGGELEGCAPTVLMLSFRGWSTHLLWEATFAHALRHRGARPVFATCGGRLPVCDAVNIHARGPMPCLSCGDMARDTLRAAGFDPITLASLVDVPAERRAARNRIAEIDTVAEMRRAHDVELDLPIGELVRISVLWHLARGTLDESPETRRCYRSFLVSAQVTARYLDRLLDEVKPDRVLTLNGLFWAEGILAALATRRGIPVATYERGFLIDTVVLSTATPACDYVVDAVTWDEARKTPLPPAAESELDDYLDERTRGLRAVDNIWEERVEEWEAIRRTVGLSQDRPFFALFSNVVWDSACQDKDDGFACLADWVVAVIEGFRARPDVDLVVRVHPAEVRSDNHPTRELMTDVIRTRVPDLPSNVRLVPPENAVSSYPLMARCRAGLVYTTTAGLEMAVAGHPVVVAGRPHYRGLGFTLDVSSSDDFWRTVDRLRTAPESIDIQPQRVELARRYAHLFFFRLMQHLDLVTEPARARPRLAWSSTEQLVPGRNAALDRIVDGVLTGRPVITPAAQ